MGKETKPVDVEVGRDLGGNFERPVLLAREKDDFYPTPADPTRVFLNAEIEKLRTFDGIWEPACGDGAQTREMHALGLKTFASDIVQRGAADEVRSFYDFKIPPFRKIVTNPPFSECGWGNGKCRWMYHALETLDVEYMALLLPWAFPGPVGIAPFWEAHKPARIYLMRWKIDFTNQGAPPTYHAWFVWEKGHVGDPPLLTLDRRDPRQCEMFAGK
jgi:hypothetical protein